MIHNGFSVELRPQFYKIFYEKYFFTRVVRKIKNVCAYNPRSCFIVPDESLGVFSRL